MVWRNRVPGRPRMSARAAMAHALLATLLPGLLHGQAPRLVKDINPILGGPGSANPAKLLAVGGVLFFEGCDAFLGCELWRSDGTPGGTYLLRDINGGPANSSIQSLTNVNGTLFF